MKSPNAMLSFLASPLATLIVDGVKASVKTVDAAAQKGMTELQEEVAKQDLRLKFDLQQAKIAQELAIAQRIADAETVTIEEFYDISGKGAVGASKLGGDLNLGVTAEGSRVSKRVYTFSGRNIIVQSVNGGE